MTVKLLPLLLLLLLTGCSGNVSSSRGEPHRGQVTSARWSVAAVIVLETTPLNLDGRGLRLQPGEATPRGERYAGFCIPAGFTGSASIATDDNPLGFPPVTVGGGGCHKLTARDVATVTVKK